MAIYCNTLEGNMQYGDDPYCFTPTTDPHNKYRIAGYLCGLQFSQMPYELVIFTTVVFVTLNLMNGIKLYLQRLLAGA